MIVYAVQEGDRILKVSKDKAYLEAYIMSFPFREREGMKIVELSKLEAKGDKYG